MRLFATIAAELQAAGITGDALVMALDRIEAAQDSRSAAAKRQAEYRARENEKKAAGITRDAQRNEPSEKEIPPTPPKENTTPLEPTRARTRGTRIPDDFRPLPNIREMSLNRGLSPAEFDDQLERFIDWAKSKSGQDGYKLDWQAACRNWMKRAADDKRKSSKHSGRSTPGQELRDAFADQQAYFDSQGYPRTGGLS